MPGFERKKCDLCGGDAMHWSTVEPKFLCCACYVARGNPPSDWHDGCMQASKAKSPA
jgi:hypothetical protein